MLTSPKQICLDLGKFQVNDLLRCQEETVTYQPKLGEAGGRLVEEGRSQLLSQAASKESAPPSRVLGYEVRERLLPMGQEIYALGNVAWRYREGSLAVLQPAEADKPTIFTLGSRTEILQKRESEMNCNGTMMRVLGSLGASGILVGCFSMFVGSRL
eukprot:Skav202871  [mRNA]  locus=scaffold3541:55698:58356:- [translate_table: standard]